jgi:hypothetical protein
VRREESRPGRGSARTFPETDAPLATLRGAGVDADARRIGAVAGGLLAAGMLAVAIVLVVAGAHKNAQITSLRREGVAVPVTVSGCRGLMGGSGSNLAGYACDGRFDLDGCSYRIEIPGEAFHAPGSVLHAVTVPGDPRLIATASERATEHASPKVYLLPGIVLAALLLAGAALLLRRTTPRGSAGSPAARTPRARRLVA